MKKNKIIILSLLILLLSLTNIYSKINKTPSISKYLLPLSISLALDLSPEFFIYQPVSNYTFEIASTFNLGLSFEYRFAKYFALDSGLFFNTGYHYQEGRYIRTGSSSTDIIRLNNIDLFLQYRLSTKVYFPDPIKLKKNYRLLFAFRFGFVLDGWLMSYYFLSKNDKLVSQGQMFDDKEDGPNAIGDYETFGEYYRYDKIYNNVNVGAHIGFMTKIYNDNKISISPEIGYIFYMIPITDGQKNGMDIVGSNALLARNNLTDDEKNLSDFKMQVEVGVSISFDFGNPDSNLYDLVPNKSASKNSKKK
jgi:hypothetical protein